MVLVEIPITKKSYFQSVQFSRRVDCKEINDSHINYVENLIRTRLPGIIANWKTRENATPINDEDFFGPIYVFDPSAFEFTPGDILQINQIVDYVRKMYSDPNIGPQHFKPAEIQNTDEITLACDELQNNVAQLHISGNSSIGSNPFLHMLTSAANQNSKTKKGGYRYENNIKKYATCIRMIAGPLAYETLQKNLPYSLPSLSSTNRYIQKTNCRIIEGVLRCEELLQFLNERKLEKVVTMSEDATRIVGRVQYDSKTNQITGFVLPLNSTNGLPVPFSFPARNVTEIMQHFDNEHNISPFVNAIIMAQPIGNEPPFCLMIYGSDNKYTSTDVCNRWIFIKSELKKIAVSVIAMVFDGSKFS